MHCKQPAASAAMSLRPTVDDSSAKSASRCHSAGLRRAGAVLGLLIGTVTLLALAGLSGAADVVGFGLAKRQSSGGSTGGASGNASWNNLYLVRDRPSSELTSQIAIICGIVACLVLAILVSACCACAKIGRVI